MNATIDIDHQFLLAIRQGDQDAFEQLFRKYYELLCCYATGILEDREQAEDVVQDIFIYFWENRETIDLKNSLRAYLYTAVRHRALKVLQKKTMEQKHNSSLTEFVEYILSTDYTLEEEKAIGQIKEVMAQLPEQCLRVFLMSSLEQKKYVVIAKELDISVNTVKTHITKAYRLIRQGLKEKLSMTLWMLIRKTCFV